MRKLFSIITFLLIAATVWGGVNTRKDPSGTAIIPYQEFGTNYEASPDEIIGSASTIAGLQEQIVALQAAVDALSTDDIDSPTVSITSSTADTASSSYTLTATVTDNVGVSAGTVKYKLNGGTLTAMNDLTGSNYDASMTLIEGINTIYVEAQDAAGNLGYTSVTITLTSSTIQLYEDFNAVSAPSGWSVAGSLNYNYTPALEGAYSLSLGAASANILTSPAVTAEATKYVGWIEKLTYPSGLVSYMKILNPSDVEIAYVRATSSGQLGVCIGGTCQNTTGSIYTSGAQHYLKIHFSLTGTNLDYNMYMSSDGSSWNSIKSGSIASTETQIAKVQFYGQDGSTLNPIIDTIKVDDADFNFNDIPPVMLWLTQDFETGAIDWNTWNTTATGCNDSNEGPYNCANDDIDVSYRAIETSATRGITPRNGTYYMWHKIGTDKAVWNGSAWSTVMTDAGTGHRTGIRLQSAERMLEKYYGTGAINWRGAEVWGGFSVYLPNSEIPDTWDGGEWSRVTVHELHTNALTGESSSGLPLQIAFAPVGGTMQWQLERGALSKVTG